jgi:hypothetical protein
MQFKRFAYQLLSQSFAHSCNRLEIQGRIVLDLLKNKIEALDLQVIVQKINCQSDNLSHIHQYQYNIYFQRVTKIYSLCYLQMSYTNLWKIQPCSKNSANMFLII